MRFRREQSPRTQPLLLFGLVIGALVLWDCWWQLYWKAPLTNDASARPQLLPQQWFTRTRTGQLRSLAQEYLSPWLLLGIPRTMLDAAEVPFHGAGVHIRVPVNLSASKREPYILYRVLDHFPQTYRDQRLRWILQLTLDALPLPPGTEFYVNLGDCPRSTADSSGRAAFAGMPIFSFRTGAAYIDIPIPDPAEYGAYGNYQLVDRSSRETRHDDLNGSDEDAGGASIRSDEAMRGTAASTSADWKHRDARAFFRGVTSAFEHHDGNEVADVRIQLHVLASRHPDLFDAGVVAFTKFENSSLALSPAAYNTARVPETPMEQRYPPLLPRTPLSSMQRYRYVLDVDGGLGSSRKRSILLSSGAVPLFQQSPWKQWYEPLLVPNVHYLPVDRWLRNLTKIVRLLHHQDREAQRIAIRASTFARHYLSYEVAVSYYRILLLQYAQLLQPRRETNGELRDAQVPWHHCAQRPGLRNGPMGCWRGWFVYRSGDALPFGCSYRRDRTPTHQCWRTLPRDPSMITLFSPWNSSGSPWLRQEKRGIHESYPTEASAG